MFAVRSPGASAKTPVTTRIGSLHRREVPSRPFGLTSFFSAAFLRFAAADAGFLAADCRRCRSRWLSVLGPIFALQDRWANPSPETVRCVREASYSAEGRPDLQIPKKIRTPD